MLGFTQSTEVPAPVVVVKDHPETDLEIGISAAEHPVHLYENPFKKFLGACNSFDSQMIKCLKKERLQHRARNREESAARHTVIRERLSKLYEEESAQ